MVRYKHLFRPLQFIVIYGSAIAFWYMFLPTHWLQLIAKLSIATVILFIMFIIMSYIVGFIVRILRKRYRWARTVFMKPQSIRSYRRVK